MGSDGAVYSPFASVVTARTCPVPVLVKVTVAPGITGARRIGDRPRGWCRSRLAPRGPPEASNATTRHSNALFTFVLHAPSKRRRTTRHASFTKSRSIEIGRGGVLRPPRVTVLPTSSCGMRWTRPRHADRRDHLAVVVPDRRGNDSRRPSRAPRRRARSRVRGSTRSSFKQALSPSVIVRGVIAGNRCVAVHAATSSCGMKREQRLAQAGAIRRQDRAGPRRA